MPEAFAWPEGSIYLYTGTATASALVALCQNLNASFTRGWYNTNSLDGTYSDHLTGQRVDVTIGAIFTPDSTLLRIFESATAVHLHLQHSGYIGSAGYRCFSGRLDNVSPNGMEGGVFSFNLTYHANRWSAYGG